MGAPSGGHSHIKPARELPMALPRNPMRTDLFAASYGSTYSSVDGRSLVWLTYLGQTLPYLRHPQGLIWGFA